MQTELRLLINSNPPPSMAEARGAPAQLVPLDVSTAPLVPSASGFNDSLEVEAPLGNVCVLVIDLAGSHSGARAAALREASESAAPPAASPPAAVAPPVGLLSVRELEVLRQAGEGLSDKEIADVLGIELCTVKSHMVHIIRKLKLQRTNRTAAVVAAAKLGLLKLC